MTWHRIIFYGAVPHVASDELQQEVLDDLLARGATLREQKVIAEWGVDLPGVVRISRPFEEFDFEGSKVAIPSEDVGSFLIRLRNLPLRRFSNGKEFVKLHGFMVAVVFTPTQRDAFRDELEKIVVGADKRVRDFDEQTLPPEVFARLYGRQR